jgi:hypothetical protein
MQILHGVQNASRESLKAFISLIYKLPTQKDWKMKRHIPKTNWFTFQSFQQVPAS